MVRERDAPVLVPMSGPRLARGAVPRGERLGVEGALLVTDDLGNNIRRVTTAAKAARTGN
jgi:hypothetical protein